MNLFFVYFNMQFKNNLQKYTLFYIFALPKRFGFVAQLNRASHYG